VNLQQHVRGNRALGFCSPACEGGCLHASPRSLEGFARRSPRTRRCVKNSAAACAATLRLGAPLRPGTAGDPFPSMSARAHGTHGASRALRREAVGLDVCRLARMADLASGSSAMIAVNPYPIGPAPQTCVAVQRPMQLSAQFSTSWGVGVRSESGVGVVAEMNGQATVATDTSQSLVRTGLPTLA